MRSSEQASSLDFFWPTKESIEKPRLLEVVFELGLEISLAAIGLSIGAIALVAAPVAGVWALLAIRLGRKEKEMAASQGETA